ncbi:MAG TPA: cytochrome-c oxidase, cbb3-type subunit III [Hydrogenophaga sp.]|jgi:cytochrome c oxidase cbb3-type subunit 3|uniref:cytochrome-c oxidase, cbb3-type subunit III n=1 Tax=Hydrogenophaga sp. TaxID=1904254 RepID=UPI0008B73B19|nr:cytochrome-c oxidase, cbb3-type subunit III [Hydrogenophaga sp.]MBU4182883.1 cytochrome-c oxidase, cbb3-type subunit III [Gammaproteobacteria bacterium]OGA78694.1 MAG: cytochrome-c oxidase, cbb3-type subunit III [Burkholderiales bacterium GWE1_65_30]OGA89266.1 MAG: cytochrome-c oxidase, cbb3-type subunit III [Burkholderiales bacterium GWF1_66_17]OGB32526.1 MAG: cytochrome-c oxidase, cbb3-type subunit III [Burkholderiales bacterium RIFCSPLOWO2_02_FULL_66_35]OGB32887.1 MAG: cytochrome-c oxida
MSDFTSDFWHLYVGGLTLVSILACLILLWISGTTKANTHADNTTGHVWDGDLAEMNNPLPRWWVYLFVITVIFALAYGALYPMFGKFQGVLGWTSRGQHTAEVAKVEAAIAPIYAKFSGMTPEQMAGDSEAMAIGERLFMNYCAQCHGSDARGAKGFPNLTDKDWLGGGDHATIKTTITQGRIGVMPPMAAAVGTAEDVRNVANYVLSLSGSPHDSVRATQGKEKFAACAACHGMDGKGMAAVGAANLTDGIWLHGWGEEAIVRAVNNGFNNQMPGQSALLNEAQINVLASYVWGMSNKAAN